MRKEINKIEATFSYKYYLDESAVSNLNYQKVDFFYEKLNINKKFEKPVLEFLRFSCFQFPEILKAFEELEKNRSNTSKLVWYLIVIPIILGVLAAMFLGKIGTLLI